MATQIRSPRFRTLKAASNDTGSTNGLPPGFVKLNSAQVPGLKALDYNINVSQDVCKAGSTTPIKSLTSNIPFSVVCSQVSIDPSEIHSTYPAPGHSDDAKTLPHIILNDPHVPWERAVPSSGEEYIRPPWLALLSFSEDELKVDATYLNAQGIAQTSSLAVNVKLPKLKTLPGVASPLMGPAGVDGVSESQGFNVVLIGRDLFKSLFSDYSGDSSPKWSGKPNVSRYAHLAHVRQANIADSLGAETNGDQGTFSILVSSRVAKVSTKPVPVYTHLVSIESLTELRVDDSRQYIALASLHSWTWTALPPSAIDFVASFSKLGQTIAPLRVDLPQNDQVGIADDLKQWLSTRLGEGYLFCDRIAPSGEATAALIRGPLIPDPPATSSNPPWSLFGTDLQIIDSKTGIVDVTMQTAWDIGRGLAIADGTFSGTLLRFRGSLHINALEELQLEAATNLHVSKIYAAKKLKDITAILKDSHNPTQAGQNTAILRWTQGQHGLNKKEELSHRKVRIGYAKKLKKGVLQAAQSTSNEPYNEFNVATNSDWASIQKWIMDKFYLSGVPSQYLLPDQSQLPSESIRTFYIDFNWVEAMIDGALSIANHFENDDDTIRREIKANINTYLRTATSADGSYPQVPRWGVAIRSVAIQAFPDLKVTAPWPAGSPNGLAEILSIQKPAEDILICLLDRMPGNPFLTSLGLAQPEHQQSYVCGTNLTWPDANTDGKLDMEIRYFTNAIDPAGNHIVKALSSSWTSSGSNSSIIPVFDWSTRSLILPNLTDYCLSSLLMQSDRTLQWPSTTPNSSHSSALLARQLSRPVFKLDIEFDQDRSLPKVLVPYQMQIKDAKTPPSDGRSPVPAPANPYASVAARLPVGSRHPVKIVTPNNQPIQLTPRPVIEYGPLSLQALAQLELKMWPLLDIGGPINPSTNVPTDIVFSLKAPDTPPDQVAFQNSELESVVVFLPIEDKLVLLDDDPKWAMGQPNWSLSHSSQWWPKVTCINRGCRWMYDVHLGRLQPDPSSSNFTGDCIAIRISARTHKGSWPIWHPDKSPFADLSFILHGVRSYGQSGADFRAYVREKGGFRVGDDYQSLGAAVNMFSQSFA